MDRLIALYLKNVDNAVSYRELKDFCSARRVHPKHISSVIRLTTSVRLAPL